jgi:hypothetical protein
MSTSDDEQDPEQYDWLVQLMSSVELFDENNACVALTNEQHPKQHPQQPVMRACSEPFHFVKPV